jgi:8-hydroxy-5-deazaflavin:NADPH oxidoreductase
MARFGVLGTGTVGTTIATKLVELGHEVRMGSRESGGKRASAWAAEAGERASEGDFAAAAEFGETVVNATAGTASLAALEQAGIANLSGKVLIDIANPLDPSGDGLPTLAFANDTSLAEEIQAALPDTRVVKTLNTVNASIMVDPGSLPEPTDVFVSGNDEQAKAEVAALLAEFGWERDRVRDLGDVSTARGPEMYMAIWLRLWRATGTAAMNIRIVGT